MAKIQHLLDKIRTAIYGKEVRGSLADGLEAINKETEDATEVAVNVEQRQDAVEQQFDDVLNEWTDDKPISNEETIAARTNRETGENHQTLGQRLDAENKKVTAQLAGTMTEKEFNKWVATILDGGPSIFYDTLEALESDYPDGAAGVALVRETDPSRIYVWNQVKESWEDFGAYQGIEIKDGTVTPEKTSFMKKSKNLFTGSYERGLAAYASPPARLRYKASSEGRVAVVPIEPDKEYTVQVQENRHDVFKVAITNSEPVFTGSFQDTDTFIIDNASRSQVSFTNTEEGRYLLVFVSESGQEPLLQVEEGSTPSNYISHFVLDSELLDDESVTTPKLKDGSVNENKISFMVPSQNLFSGKYEKILLEYSGIERSLRYRYSLDPSYRTAVIKIEPNKTYTVKKHSDSDGFRVAVLNSDPETEITGYFKNTDRLIINEDEETEITFTNDTEGKYLFVYVSNQGIEPKLQVEEGPNATPYKKHKVIPLSSTEIGSEYSAEVIAIAYEAKNKAEIAQQDASEANNKVSSLNIRNGSPYTGMTSPMQPTMLTEIERMAKGGVVGTGGKPVISLRFDHIRDFGEKIMPLLRERGLVASVALNPGLDPQTAGDETFEKIRGYVMEGIEVWSHSMTHNDPTPGGLERLVYELVDSKELIESEGIKCMGWVLPGVTPVSEEKPYAPNGFSDFSDYINSDAGRLVTQTYGISEAYCGGVYRQLIPSVYHGLDHITIDSRTVESVKNSIDIAIRRCIGIEFMQHPWVLDREGFITTKDLAEILDYIALKRDEGELEVLTPSSLMFADKRTDYRLELFSDGDFENVTEEDPRGWSIASDHSIEVENGNKYLTIPASSATFTNNSTTTINYLGVSGEVFMFEGWARANSGTTANARVILRDVQDESRLKIDRTKSVGGEWTKILIPFSLTPDTTNFQIRLGKTGSIGVDWDDVKVYKV